MTDPTAIPMGSCAPPDAANTSIATAPLSIGPYHVIEQVGVGGMGIVYRAEQRHPIRRTVALKLVKPGYGSSDVLARFGAERQALALMDHPNVARVFDAGTTSDGRPYFVMEFVPGEPITRFADHQRLSIDDRLRLFTHVCDAIGHAHTKGIIHRDIKAGNVLAFMQDGRATVKVIDFGIAKALAGDRLTDATYDTARGQLVGTYESMSPEQAEGSLDIDTRTDVYSLGVLFYELLTGLPPFDRRTLASASDWEKRQIIREQQPPRPSTRLLSLRSGDQLTRLAQIAELRGSRPIVLARQLRGELESIPLMAMRKDRQRRYASPVAMAADVENYLQGRPLIAGPESRVYRARKFIARNRAGVITTVAVLMLALVGSVFYLRGLRAEQRKTQEALVEARQQRRHADDQAAIAKAVTRFQSEMLSSADPLKLLGENVTVLQVAEAALADLDNGRLKDQPLVDAAVRATIGETFGNLGRSDRAAQQLQRALELRQSALPADDPEIALNLELLGNVLRERGKLNEAETVLRQAVQTRRRTAAANDPALGAALNSLALLLKDAGRLDEGELTFREAIPILRAAKPNQQKELSVTLNNFARLLQERGKLEEAETLYAESLDLKRRTLPPAHPSIANTLGNLAGLYLAQHRPAEAVPLLREALEIRRKSLPAEHVAIASSLNDIGLALYKQGKLEEAEPWLQDGLAMYRKVLSAEHPQVAVGLINLGLLRQAQRRTSEAESLFAEALAINRRSLAAGHPQIANSLLCLAELLRAERRFAEAEPLYREVLETNRKALTPDHPYIAMGVNAVAGVLRDQGKFAEAEPMFRESLARHEKLYGRTDARTCRAAFWLAYTLDQVERAQDAAAVRASYRLGDPATRPTTKP